MKMKLVCVNIFCLIIFVNLGSAIFPPRGSETTENINDLRYPKPLNITGIFPFRVLRTIFNMTTLEQSVDRGTNRITSQVSAVVDVLRRVLRFMVRNALGVSPLRASMNLESTTTASTSEKSNVSIDLPTFSVVNDAEFATKNDTEELSNHV